MDHAKELGLQAPGHASLWSIVSSAGGTLNESRTRLANGRPKLNVEDDYCRASPSRTLCVSMRPYSERPSLFGITTPLAGLINSFCV